MRVLFTTLPEYGHFHPLVPLAQALAERGHDVAFATAADFCPRVERTGFIAFPAGLSHAHQLAEAQRRYPEEANMPAGQERFLAFVPRMLAGVAAPAMLPDLMPVVREWQPDIIVHDEADCAGPVAASVAGIPYVGHGVGIVRPFDAIRLAGRTLQPLAREWGVDLGSFGGMFQFLYLGICPPAVQAPHVSEIDVAYPIRALFDAAPDEGLPAWVADLPPRPTVYVTLGTIFNRMSGLFRSILEGIRGDDVNVIVTVGYDADPAALGPQPDNVHIEHYIPQSLLLPYCDLIVGQGGWSFLSVLSEGLPLVLLPQGANQFYHSQSCVDSGAARMLMPSEITPEAVRREVQTVLGEPGYRANAHRIKQEFDAMPAPQDVVPLIELVQRERRPPTRQELELAATLPPPSFTQPTSS